jgi:hypothetical protein
MIAKILKKVAFLFSNVSPEYSLKLEDVVEHSCCTLTSIEINLR